MNVRSQRKDEHRLRLTRMNHDRESEVTRQAVRDRCPLVTAVIGAVNPAMVLREDPVRYVGMGRDLVYALPELGPRVRRMQRDDADIRWIPGLTLVIGPVDPASRH